MGPHQVLAVVLSGLVLTPLSASADDVQTARADEIVAEYRAHVSFLVKEGTTIAKKIGVGQVMAYSDIREAKKLEGYVVALGKLRAKDAVPFLVGIIRFNRPEVAPGRLPTFQDAVAAVSLVEIGLPAVRPLGELLGEEPTWRSAIEVIRRILGDGLTVSSLSDEHIFPKLTDETREKCRNYLIPHREGTESP